MPQQVGLIGLAVMGQNLALNIARRGFGVAVYNRTTSRMRQFIAERATGEPIEGFETLEQFVGALEQPRRIVLMVKAGSAVDDTIAAIRPLLQQGDILADGGNSFFLDTRRRAAQLAEAGILYLGCGISGGEYGALHGPSIMAGGSRRAYDAFEPLLQAISADGIAGKCCAYLGPDGAGHFVKMVHNGIEYGLMQLIAEAYDILRRLEGLQPSELAEIFARYNAGPLNSYLMQITAEILARTDELTGKPLLEVIDDAAGQKGTGLWAVCSALELGIAVPTIASAVEARIISTESRLRRTAAALLPPEAPEAKQSPGSEKLAELVQDALYGAALCCWAQGFEMLAAGSRRYNWALNPAEIARIWTGGCIIRSAVLEKIRRITASKPGENLLLHKPLRQAVIKTVGNWRRTVELAVRTGIATPALSASLAYYDSLRTARLPQNLVQAQRDYFGAHGYRRIDKPGSFHTKWQQS